jgi:UDP-N-acetyl-D-galactosamine dehydrogenase
MITDFLRKKKSIAVVGLGYVGLPLAVELSRFFKIIGVDSQKARVQELSSGIDRTGEIPGRKLSSSGIAFTHDPRNIKKSYLIIVAVPTPVDNHNIPDLTPLKSASEMVGKHLRRGAVVVYESTVYPGVTEEICVPLLERFSRMRCGKDFKIGYSPERVNPGDRKHGISEIIKVVSAQDNGTLHFLAKVYGKIIKAGIHKAPDIKTAEAAKVIENIQRDLNIALVNELAIIFNMMGIDSGKVLEAAATKWNFLPFQPGLVGGHCIGVDPYYLTYKAQSVGYHPEIILSGRRINDNMGKYIASNTIKQLIKSGKCVKNSKILILGITFKENIHDIRNSKVIDIWKELTDNGIHVSVYDPHADKAEVSKTYGISLLQKPQQDEAYDGIILAVKHREFRKFSPSYLKKICREKPVCIDIKSSFDAGKMIKAGFHYWRL